MLRRGESAANFDLRRFPVAASLAPFVERFWSVRWDRRAQPSYRSEVLTHPCVNLAVESGGSPTDRRHGVALPAGLVHGVVSRRFSIDLAGEGRVFGVTFRPGGFAAFTGGRPLRDTVVPVHSVFGPDGDALVQGVLAEADDEERAQVADARLAAWAPEAPRDYLDLLALLAEMLGDRSLARTDQVARRAAASPRALQRLFRRYVGIGPKWVLRRYRLQDAAAAIDDGSVTELASLATDLGWFDQAHFSRDFREAVGVTPSEYLAAARRARG